MGAGDRDGAERCEAGTKAAADDSAAAETTEERIRMMQFATRQDYEGDGPGVALLFPRSGQ